MGLRQALRNRFIRLGKPFPRPAADMDLRWVDAPATLFVFWSPQCQASRQVVRHVRLLMESVAGAAEPAVKGCRCILVACHAADSAGGTGGTGGTRPDLAVLESMGCTGMHGTAAVAWDAATVEQCCVRTVTTVTLVGMTGKVKYSGLDSPDNAALFVHGLTDRMRALSGPSWKAS